MRKFFARATVNKSGNYVRLEQSRAQDFRCSSLLKHKIAESLSQNSLSLWERVGVRASNGWSG